MPSLINETALRFGVFVARVPPAPLSATLVAKCAFDLRHDGEVTLVPADDQPMLDGDRAWDEDPLRGLRSASDFAPFKPGTDLLLAAHCHAPGGRPVEFTQVSFRVGQFRKSAAVIGDRAIGSGGLVASVSRPRPFVRLPLDWSRAWGGADVPENPLGRGRSETLLEDGTRVRLAANVESIEHATTSTGSSGRPFGFGPIDPAWKQRMKKVGTYDAAWLESRWPFFPDDFDWTFFSSAPEDQYLHQVYLRGDEELEFVNLHPEHPAFRTRLPGLFARCFIRVRRGTTLEFIEVPMRIDTLFADLDAGQVHLTWRGVTPAATLKLKEIEDYFVLLEPKNAPSGKSLSDYEELYRRRRAELEAEFDVPPVVLEPLVLPKLTPSSDAWVAVLGKLAEEIRAEAKAALKPPPPPAMGPAGQPLPPFKLPPTPKPKSIAEVNAQAKLDFAAIDEHAPGFSAKYPPPDFSDMEADEAELAALDVPDDEEGPAEGAADEGDWTRERVQAHAAERGDFTGQDLSELDLSGIDFSGLNLAGADLAAACLKDCLFARADLRGADLSEAVLTGTAFDDAELAGADLSKVNAAGASFRKAGLEEADFTGADLTQAVFTECRASRASFFQAQLSGSDFTGARLIGADLMGGNLSGAVFDEANLTSADLEEADATGAKFRKISAWNLRASKTLFHGASFRDCMAEEAVFEESILTETDFRGARLKRATLSGARLDRAVFGLADLRMAKLDDACAREATFVGVDLFRAILERADLTRATFLDCNLFEVEFWDAVIERSQFRDSNLKGTRLGR